MSSNEINRGMLIRIHGDLYQVMDFSEQHTGKQKSKTHVTLRNLRNGHVTDKLLETIQPIEEVPHEIREMQYLYSSADELTFMDNETFEQHAVPSSQLGDATRFLVEGEAYRVFCANDLPVNLELPDALVMEVTDTAPPSHAPSGASNVTKEAVIASGMTVRVPLFIKNGDSIRLDTTSGKYVGKEN